MKPWILSTAGRAGDRWRAAIRWVRVHRRPVLLSVLGIALAGLGWVVLTWPDVEALRSTNPQSTAFIQRYLERTGRSSVAWTPVPASRISPHLKEAVLVSEDLEFFSHDGFSTHEIGVALREAIEEWEPPRGASTITQQLAKNLWLSPSRNPLRKAREVILTKQLERQLGKERILELYLNVVEFGPGVYGAEAAARRYFGKSAGALGPREAAMLAAALPRPSQWHPGVESASYARRVDRILRLMERVRFLDRRLGITGPSGPEPAPTGIESAGTDSIAPARDSTAPADSVPSADSVPPADAAPPVDAPVGAADSAAQPPAPFATPPG